MKAILHIGTEKTGTTSFQMFMNQNRRSILSRGILYPEGLGGYNHRSISAYALSFGSDDDYVRSLGWRSQQDADRFRCSVEAIINRQVNTAKASGMEFVVFSSEHLHSRLTTVDQIGRIFDLLRKFFDDIRVYVHLRPQVDVLTSLASTQARVGGAVRKAFFERARADNIYFNYDMLVAAWEEVFGSSNLSCLAFSRSPDFLEFLAGCMNLKLEGLIAPERLNEALDVRTISMVNALVDSGSTVRIDFRLLDMLPVERRLEIDRATAVRIQGQFFDSNRSLIARRPELEEGDLEPKWSRYPEMGNLHLLEERCSFSSMLGFLVGAYNNLESAPQKSD